MLPMKKILTWAVGILLIWIALSIVVWTGDAQRAWMEFNKCSGFEIPKLINFCNFALLCNHLYCPIFALAELILFPLIWVGMVSIALAMLTDTQPLVFGQTGNWSVAVLEGYLLFLALVLVFIARVVQIRSMRRKGEAQKADGYERE